MTDLGLKDLSDHYAYFFKVPVYEIIIRLCVVAFWSRKFLFNIVYLI